MLPFSPHAHLKCLFPSKQNITRDTEVKNNLTIASGEGIVGRGVFRNSYKGHMDKIKGEEGGGFGWGGVDGWGENADTSN